MVIKAVVTVKVSLPAELLQAGFGLNETVGRAGFLTLPFSKDVPLSGKDFSHDEGHGVGGYGKLGEQGVEVFRAFVEACRQEFLRHPLMALFHGWTGEDLSVGGFKNQAGSSVFYNYYLVSGMNDHNPMKGPFIFDTINNNRAK